MLAGKFCRGVFWKFVAITMDSLLATDSLFSCSKRALQMPVKVVPVKIQSV
jgi:hypothetical protein